MARALMRVAIVVGGSGVQVLIFPPDACFMMEVEGLRPKIVPVRDVAPRLASQGMMGSQPLVTLRNARGRREHRADCRIRADMFVRASVYRLLAVPTENGR